MRDAERFKLYFGPYRQPRYRIGQVVECQRRGEVRIIAQSDARIPWPIAVRKGRGSGPSLVICGGLAKAIRSESIVAVAYWWGVKPHTVTDWRRKLGIKGEPVGTSQLRSKHLHQPWADGMREKAWSKLGDASRREKIAASKRGKPRPPALMTALHNGNVGRKHSEETRRAMSEAHKRRGTRPPWLNKPWEPWEDELVRTLTITEAAVRTGRSASAVQNRRLALKVPDGRRRAERAKVGRSV